MSHTFEVPFKGDATSLINKAKTTIQKAEGSLEGNEESGNFNVPAKIGNVEGTYIVENNSMIVTIHKKPMIAPYSMIEEALRKFLA